MAAPKNEKRYLVVVSAQEANLPRNSRSAKITKTTADTTGVGRRWNNLPEDLVGEIMVRLSLADRIRFAACCNKFWSLMAKYKNWDIDQLPWLMEVMEPHLKHPSGYEYKLFDPIHETPYSYNCVHKISDQLRPSKDVIKLLASKHGWLLLLWEKRVKTECQNICFTATIVEPSFVIVSPFTKQTITLPDLHQSSAAKLATFSAEPSSPDCVYFVFHCDGPFARVSTLRNGDSEWATFVFDSTPQVSWFDGVVYYEGSFYCSASDTLYLSVCDVNRNEWRFVTCAIPTKFREKLSISERYNLYTYVLVCEGKLLLVYLLVVHDTNEDQCLVFEYDQSDWAEKTSLGHHALFLCHSGSFSISTSSNIANRVYYYRPGGDGKKQYYSLQDGKSYQCVGSSYWPGTETSATWIEPPHLDATQRNSVKIALS